MLVNNRSHALNLQQSTNWDEVVPISWVLYASSCKNFFTPSFNAAFSAAFFFDLLILPKTKYNMYRLISYINNNKNFNPFFVTISIKGFWLLCFVHPWTLTFKNQWIILAMKFIDSSIGNVVFICMLNTYFSMNIWFQFVLGKSLQGWTLVGPVATTSFKAYYLTLPSVRSNTSTITGAMEMFACRILLASFTPDVCRRLAGMLISLEWDNT